MCVITKVAHSRVCVVELDIRYGRDEFTQRARLQRQKQHVRETMMMGGMVACNVMRMVNTASSNAAANICAMCRLQKNTAANVTR